MGPQKNNLGSDLNFFSLANYHQISKFLITLATIFILGVCIVHVVFWWCIDQRGPSPKGKKSIWNHPHNQTNNRYCNIYVNNPLKLKQAYSGSRGKTKG
jgi:hypothetical protein